MKALIGQKIGMTQIFDANGNVQNVTVVQAGPCIVTQVKTDANDGYSAVQIGYGESKRVGHAQAGHLKPSQANSKVLKEVPMPKVDPADLEAETEVEQVKADIKLKVGTKLDVSVFEVGDKIRVSGVSKGKGFAGTIKRHNFSRGPKTHGSHNYRAPGSIGSGYPEHVFKGMKMAGRMGGQQVTVTGLKVIMVDTKNNLLALSGATPGPRKGHLLIRGM